MKSFNKILCLVLTLTMMVSLVAMPSAFAAIRFPVGDTSNYEVAATFVNANEGDLENAEAGSTAYLKLELKNISTLNTGYAAVTLEGATFVAQNNKLSGNVFSNDHDTTEFSVGGTYASYGLVTDSSNLTSTNRKVKYYAFPAPTDMYLALYEIKIDDAATEVTATVSHNLKLGDANGTTGNVAATAEGIKLTNDTLAIGEDIGGGDPDPVVTYRYIVKWAVSDANDVVFPAGTTDEEITSKIKVYMTTLEDGVVVDTKEMTTGYKIALVDGEVNVTIAENPNPDIVCDISYSIAKPDPVVTHKYSAAWRGMTTSVMSFPENATDDEIKAEVVVYMTTLEDGVVVDTKEMTAGYRVLLNDGAVTVTIDGDFDADITCGLTYTVESHDPVVAYDYDIDWNVTPEFMYGTSDAYIMSCIKVTKYTFEDGVKVNTEVITTGYTVTLNNGVATVSIGDLRVDRTYTILDKVEYKNAKIVADNVEYDFDLAEEYVGYHAEVTVEKWVNDAKADDITLERDRDYVMTVTFSENSNDGKFDAELIGDYANVAKPQSVTFERTCPPVIFADVSAHLTQTEFPEGVTEEEIVKTVVVTGTVKVGNLPAENKTLKNNVDYITSVRFDEKIVILNFASEDVNEIILDFTITPAVITYKNAAAGLSDSVFGSVPTAEEIISRLSVKAEKYKDDVFSDVVEITSENYDLTIGEGEVTISFKGAYATLEDVTVEFTVEEVAYGDPVVTVDGTISGDGKVAAAIIEEAWALISAVRDILTNGIVTGSETLDKVALETLGVVANYADGKVTFAYNGAVIAEVSVSAGKLQFASEDPRTAATEFIKFVGATLKNIIENIKIKADTFQIITLNDEWISLYDAIEAGTATVTYGGETYDNTNIADADEILVSEEDSVSMTVEYDNAITDIEVSLLEVPTDYANDASEAPVVSITTDKAQVQTGTDVLATVYVAGLTGNVETGSVSVLFSNAEVTEDDIVAADGFEILSKTVSGNEINVVFTINNAAYDAGAGIFTFSLDTTNSDVNANLGLAINNYALTRIVDMGGYNDYRPINATIGNNVEVAISAGDVYGYEYEVSYKSGKTVFYTDADAVADVKVLAYTTTNGVRDENQTPSDVTAAASINANNGVITVDKDGIRVTTLTYTIYEVAFEQVVAIETIGSVADAKFTDNVTVKLDGAAFSGANVALDGRTIKVSVAGIKAVGTYEIAVAVPGYTKATINVVVSKKATNDGYDAAIVSGSKIYAGDINGDNRIDAVDFSDVAGKYGQAKETKYDLYTGNDSTTIDNLDVTTMAHYFIELARGLVSADGTTITPYAGN